MLAMASAVLMFALMDATIKHLASAYDPFQLAAVRCFVSLIVLLPFLLYKGRLRELIPHQPLWHVGRASLGILTLTSFVYAVAHLSLGITYAIYLCGPLLIAAISAGLLGHGVSARHWMALCSGLLGVLLIVKPFTDTSLSLTGIAAALLSATAYSLNLLSVSRMTQRNSSRSLVFWFLLLVGLACGAIATSGWKPIRATDYPWLAAIGVTGMLGQYLITRALQLAPAYVVAPVEYTSIVWALAIDAIFWSRPLTAVTVLGAVVIILSGRWLDVSSVPSSPDDEVSV
jgi:drug/metabolite transporter (DMT)-like permease